MVDARPGFNHNDFYHRFLLRQVPPGCERALDVGCGTGTFARRLAHHAHTVDGVDRYDYISCLASIHHMPFTETITKLRNTPTPGGVLAIIGCYRESTVADYPSRHANAGLTWPAHVARVPLTSPNAARAPLATPGPPHELANNIAGRPEGRPRDVDSRPWPADSLPRGALSGRPASARRPSRHCQPPP